MAITDIIEFIQKYSNNDHSLKKKFAEVFTPLTLVEDMLNVLPNDIWSNPNIKFLDPANGIGAFPIILIKKLMIGLKDVIKNENERYKHIIENQIYICELQEKNISIYLNLFNPENEYNMNYYIGSFIEKGFDLYMKNNWKLEEFDIVVGNPPYQNIPIKNIKKTSGSIIWDKFVIKSLSLLKYDGYLILIHPSTWRKPINNNSKLLNILDEFKKYNLININIHNSKDGLKIFGANTRYDYYCLRKNNDYEKTIIIDENRNISKLDIRKVDFIPNKNIEKVFKLLGDDRISIIYNSSYHANSNIVSIEKDNIFKYPIIHSTTKKEIRIMYSSLNNKGHFGIPKLIFGESGINNVIVDLRGEYGMTQGALGLVLENDDDPILIKKVLESDDFKIIIDSCMWSNFRIDAKLFMLFKKGWYYEFLKNN